MKKTKTFQNTRLSAAGMKELDQYLTAPGAILDNYHTPNLALIHPDGSEWSFDTAEAFLADYHPSFGSYYERGRGHFGVTIVNYSNNPNSKVTVAAPDKQIIEVIFGIIERNPHAPAAILPARRGWKVYCRNPVGPLRRRRQKRSSKEFTAPFRDAGSS